MQRPRNLSGHVTRAQTTWFGKIETQADWSHRTHKQITWCIRTNTQRPRDLSGHRYRPLDLSLYRTRTERARDGLTVYLMSPCPEIHTGNIASVAYSGFLTARFWKNEQHLIWNIKAGKIVTRTCTWRNDTKKQLGNYLWEKKVSPILKGYTLLVKAYIEVFILYFISLLVCSRLLKRYCCVSLLPRSKRCKWRHRGVLWR